jgi:hypothetical protein
MTDGFLMDAECEHGVAWYECETCEALATLEAERDAEEMIARERFDWN